MASACLEIAIVAFEATASGTRIENAKMVMVGRFTMSARMA